MTCSPRRQGPLAFSVFRDDEIEDLYVFRARAGLAHAAGGR
jgi:hypothetical protein